MHRLHVDSPARLRPALGGSNVRRCVSVVLALLLMAPSALRLLSEGTRPLRVMHEEQPA